MKRGFFTLSFLPLLCLSSCADSFSGPRIIQNGDLYESEATSYSDVCRETTADEIIERVNGGEKILYFWYSESCSHCISLAPKFVPVIKDFRYEVLASSYSIYSAKTDLIAAFPAFEQAAGNYGTPSLFLFESPEKVSRLPVAENSASTKSLSRYLQKTVRTYDVIDFTRLTPFTSYVSKNACTILIDSGDEQGNAKWKSLKSGAEELTGSYAHLGASEMRSEEKEALPDLFKIESGYALFESDGHGNYRSVN